MIEFLQALRDAHKRDPSYFPMLIILCVVLALYKLFV